MCIIIKDMDSKITDWTRIEIVKIVHFFYISGFCLFDSFCYIVTKNNNSTTLSLRCIYKGANITVGLSRDHRLFILVREYMYRYTTYCKHNSSNKDI